MSKVAREYPMVGAAMYRLSAMVDEEGLGVLGAGKKKWILTAGENGGFRRLGNVFAGQWARASHTIALVHNTLKKIPSYTPACIFTRCGPGRWLIFTSLPMRPPRRNLPLYKSSHRQ